jgi:hypothetical protein
MDVVASQDFYFTFLNTLELLGGQVLLGNLILYARGEKAFLGNHTKDFIQKISKFRVWG